MTKLYSNLKFLGYPDRIAALREERVAAPVHVRIKPMNHCNHSCWYCAYRTDDLQLGEDIDLKEVLPEAKMFEVVEDVLEMGVKAVTFSGGGEPLLYKPLPEVVERLAKGGIRVATLTNGSNLKGRMADAFAEYGTWVRVSMDGWDGPSYAKSRSISEDAFDKLIANMRAFAARDSKCVLGVSFIIGQANHAHVYDVCSMLKDVGVNHVKLTGAVVANEGEVNNQYHRDIMDVVTRQIEKAQALSDDHFTAINHYHELDELFDKDYHTCPFLQFLTVIGADCGVYTCQDKAFTESGLLGNIRDQRFRDFWYSEENRQRLYGLDPSVSCRHHCVAHGKNLALHEVLSLDTNHGSFV